LEKPGSNSGDWAGNYSADPRESFAMLYKQYLPKVFRYVSYKVGNTSVAEDLTSNVFEKALVSFSRYRSDKAAFSTWLFSIARHTMADYFKVNRKRVTIPLDFIADTSEEDNPEDTLSKKEELQRLHVFLSRLSPQEQEIISLKFGAEVTNRQIAGMLKLSESNVGVIVYRAVHKLRTNFRGRQDG
jgi:RNA polymerase sigma-70 factor (ECF subfamily)